MAKGYRKRVKSGCFFKLKNTFSGNERKLKYQPVAGTSSEVDCDKRQAPGQSKGHNSIKCGIQHSKPQLRPRTLKIQKPAMSGNRIVDISKMVAVMNSLYSCHRKSNGKCVNLSIQLLREVKLGLAWKFQFKCKNCNFESELYKTYNEIPNSKGAAINTNLAMAIMDTPIGISKARLLFTALDIPPPNRSHLQSLTNTVSGEIIALNEVDMTGKLHLVEQHNIAMGVPKPKHIDVSVDGRYNARGFKSSYKPGQSSSQAYTVAIENTTKERYIIGLAVENKLCWTGAWLKNRGFNVQCPGGHADCTANIPYLQSHSERKMTYKIAEDLSLQNFWIRTVTTDGDSKSYLGLKDFYKKLDEAWQVSRQADPFHLAALQEKKARTAQFSKNMLPDKIKTKDGRQRAITAFSKDIRARCSKIIEELARLGDGDLIEMLPKLPSVRAATINCYSGNCSFCPTDSLVCSGVSEGSWWVKSAFLPTHGITHLKMDDNDKLILDVIFQMRLSETAVRSVSSNTSTQKNEAFNRAAVSTLSKETNYSRNFGGRLAAQVHKANNSVAKSVKRKLECVSSTHLSDRAAHELEQISKNAHYHKKYQSTGAYKKKRVATRARLEFEHYLLRENEPQEPDYIKGQADDGGHTYASKMPKKR